MKWSLRFRLSYRRVSEFDGDRGQVGDPVPVAAFDGIRRGEPAATDAPNVGRLEIFRDVRRHAGIDGMRHDSSNAVGNFCFEVSLSYRRVELPRRVSATQ